VGVDSLSLTVPDDVTGFLGQLNLEVDGSIIATAEDQFALSSDSVSIAAATNVDLAAADTITLTTTDFQVSAMNYKAEGYDSYEAMSLRDMRLGTSEAGLRMLAGGDAQLQQVGWDHPDSSRGASTASP
jgi:hypothetical protein